MLRGKPSVHWRLTGVLLLTLSSSVLTSNAVQKRHGVLQSGLNGRSATIAAMVCEISTSGWAEVVVQSGTRLRVVLPLDGIRIHVGDRVTLQGEFKGAQDKRNPFDFDEPRYFHSKGWLTSISNVTGLVVDHTHHETSLRYRLGQARNWIRKRIFDRLSREKNQHFLAALILGDRTGLNKTMIADFQVTGLSHILAISGLHVAVVAGLAHLLIRLIVIRIPIKTSVKSTVSSSLQIACVWVFAVLVGLSPSVERASIMLSIWLISSISGRKWGKHQVLTPLGVACFVVLIARPNDVVSPGFQLSFAAVGSILISSPQRPSASSLSKPLSRPGLALRVTVAATIGTSPVLAYHFGFVPLAALLFSPPAVLLLSLVLPIALLGILLPFGYSSLVMVSEIGLSLLQFIVSKGSTLIELPSWTGPIHSVPAGLWIILFVFLLGLCGKTTKNRGILLVSLLIFSIYSSLKPKNAVYLTFFDVGQGDALAIENPNKTALFVDMGSGNKSGRTVLEHAKGRGLFRSYALILSHSHLDHTGGLPIFIKEISARQSEHSQSLPKTIYHGGWLPYSDAETTPLKRGDTIDLDPSIRLYVLHPGAPGGDNDHSVVVLLKYGANVALLMGDAEEKAEGKILAHYSPLLSADIIKVGHHGSRTSSSSAFLNNVQPKLAVISASANNFFGHPHKEAVVRLQKTGTKIIKTSDQGAVLLALDGHSIKRINWNN